jgi:hypothetical protein
MSASLDPHLVLDKGIIRNYTVASGQTVRGGFAVKFASDDQEIQEAGADSELAIGVARGIGETYAAGESVSVVHSNAIVEMKVGTGGVTRGKDARMISDGITDAPAFVIGGSTLVPIIGKILQTGVAADVVGVLIPGGISYRVAT